MLNAFEFREPLWLLACLIALPIYWMLTRPTGVLRFGSTQIWKGGQKSWKAKTAFIPPLLFSLGFISLVIALAGPRIPGGVVVEDKSGIAIMLAVDKSGSMAALDMSTKRDEKTRMDVLKSVVEKFIDGDGKDLKGRDADAIGLISFAAYPETLAPLTLDHASLDDIVKNLHIVSSEDEDGTNIGESLALAVSRLDDSKAKSKIIILLTDGDENRGTINPLDAAKLAKDKNIKIYTIAVGKDGNAFYRVTDPRTGQSYLDSAYFHVDETVLRKIAQLTHAKFFRAGDENALLNVYKTIDKLEKSKIEERRYTTYDEKFPPFALLGALLAALALLLRAAVYKKSP